MPSVLVYRDRLLAPPEGFVPRQYQAFAKLRPVFLGSIRDRAFDLIRHDKAILGEVPGLRTGGTLLFKQFGRVPEPLLDWLKRHDVQIVHGQFGRGGALALPIARALRVPLVVTFHGGDATKQTHFRRSRPFPTIFQRRWQDLQAYASRFLCVSDFIRARLRDRGVADRLLEVHHLGVDLPPPPASTKVPSKRLLVVGRFVAKKGFRRAIQALRLIRANGIDLELDLIGDGPLRAELEQDAHGLPARFLGWRTSEQVADAMRHALALLVPSEAAAGGDSEGLPTVVLEAQARGLPVIATRHAGIPEAIEDGVTGLLAPEGDAAGLAEAIGRLSADPELRARLRQNALLSVREAFDAERQSRRLEQRLLALIGQRPDMADGFGQERGER